MHPLVKSKSRKRSLPIIINNNRMQHRNSFHAFTSATEEAKTQRLV